MSVNLYDKKVIHLVYMDTLKQEKIKGVWVRERERNKERKKEREREREREREKQNNLSCRWEARVEILVKFLSSFEKNAVALYTERNGAQINITNFFCQDMGMS